MSIIQGPAHDLLTGNDRAVIDPVSQVDEHVFMCGSAVGSGLLVSNARMLKNLKNLQGGMRMIQYAKIVPSRKIFCLHNKDHMCYAYISSFC